MKIAIIADDEKKELITEFCLAYCGTLSKHTLCATGKTANYITDSTGLVIESVLSGALGGIEHITSRVTYDEVDMLIFFRDAAAKDGYMSPEINELLRVCDMFNVPVATNIAVAEVLILALDNGNLNWRDIVRDKNGQ